MLSRRDWLNVVRALLGLDDWTAATWWHANLIVEMSHL